MKRLTLLLLASFFTTFLFASDGIGLANSYALKKKNKSKFDKNRLFVGGGLGGGSLLNGGFFVAASPTVGYAFTDRFHAGFSLGLNFFRNKYNYSNYNTGAIESFVESGFHYSPSIFARFFPLDFLFLQVRPEYNSFKYYDTPSVDTDGTLIGNPKRLNVPSFLVGAGYAQRLGGMSYLTVSLMYDVLQNPNSPYYRQPIFGGGLALGLFGGR